MEKSVTRKRYSLVFLVALIRTAYTTFSGDECLKTHNSFRSLHANTPSLKYSPELAKEAQQFANLLANNDSSLQIPTRDLPKRKRRNVNPTSDPFFHKELWDGEILFPPSSRDLNKGTTVRVGESIHKFCCYSFPLCPSEFFHNLNFPPSAKGVVGHFYKEINSYDFAKGRKKPDVYKDQQIRHFTNIVWKKTSEVGCAQSKRNQKGCVYTVIRYRTEGSVGAEEDFKANVHPIGPDDEVERVSPERGGSLLSIFIGVVVVVGVLLVVCVFAYIKRQKIRWYYNEYRMKRDAKKAEASLRDDYDEESGARRPSIISKFTTKKSRPSIYPILNAPLPNTVPLQAREPAPIYQNVTVSYSPGHGAVTTIDTPPAESAKVPPPRPMSAVKAESPDLRHQSSGSVQSDENRQPAPSQRHSLPSPPTTSAAVNSTRPASSIQQQQQQPTDTNAKTKAMNSRPVPKPYVNLEYDSTPDFKQSDSSVATGSPPTGGIRAPIPAPRNAKPQASNGAPKPAPRKAKFSAAQEQFQNRQLGPGRASKKNPNFRTLPLNDRSSIKRFEKPKNERDGEDNNANLQGSSANSAPKKVPLLPTKKPKPEAAKKPMVPKHLDVVEEEDTKRSSVAEMRRLLEQNSNT